jgi:hypothetical protein
MAKWQTVLGANNGLIGHGKINQSISKKTIDISKSV